MFFKTDDRIGQCLGCRNAGFQRFTKTLGFPCYRTEIFSADAVLFKFYGDEARNGIHWLGVTSFLKRYDIAPPMPIVIAIVTTLAIHRMMLTLKNTTLKMLTSHAHRATRGKWRQRPGGAKHPLKIDEKVFAETRLRRGAYGQRYDGTVSRKLAFADKPTKGPNTMWDAPGMLGDVLNLNAHRDSEQVGRATPRRF